MDHSLWRYIDRELSASELSAISTHLKGCEQCRAQYHEWAREASQYRRVLDETPFGEAFVGRLRHRMRDEGLFASSRRSPLEALSFHRRRVRRIATVAAMLFLIPVVVVVGILSNLRDPVQLGNFTAEGAEGGLVTFTRHGAPSDAPGGRRLKQGNYAAGDGFEVPEGVVVTLKLGSPSRREDSILILSGPASFVIDREATKVNFNAHLGSGVLRADVARRALVEPFAITTENARVRVLGTEFELSALDSRTVLTVRKGIVAFQSIKALPGKGSIEVTRDKSYVVDKDAMQPMPLEETAGRQDPAPEAPPPRPASVPSHAGEATPPPRPASPEASPAPVPTRPPVEASPKTPRPEPDLDTPVDR